MYKPKDFKAKELIGISAKNIEEHLKLYEGYVNNTNKILERLQSDDLSSFEFAELNRRLPFEYNGMKNHEYYFTDILSTPVNPDIESPLHLKIHNDFGDFGKWLNSFKQLAKTRGVGWAILGYDKDNDRLINYWVDEQHHGHLNSVQYILGIDMWEHAYVGDFWSSGKSEYIDRFFDNLNWKSVEKRYENAIIN